MSLLEFSAGASMSREEAARRLRLIADMLERHNGLEFEREGLRYDVAVPDQVVLDVELELGDDENELEIEISW
jgi:amphi-Trp domain-containing protein